MSKVFSEVLHIINGKNQRSVENPNGKYPIYGSGGIMGYADDYLCEAETVIIGRKGSINKPIYIEEPFWNVDTAFGLVADKTVLLPRYLFYFCVNYDFEKLNRTVTIPSLTKSDLLKVEINLPDIIFQQKVVERLDSVENCIKLYQIQLQKLDELIKSRFVDMFGDPITNEYKWARVNLGGVCRIQSSKRVFEKDYVTNGIPFLRTKEIVELSNGKPISTELFISTEHFNSLKSKYGVPQKNDLLVSAVGTIGTIWIVDGSFDFYYKDGNIIQIKPSERFNSLFMKHLLEKLINNYKNKMSTGTAYSALTIVGIKKMEAYDVPIELQNKFADFVTKVEQQKATVQKSIDKLETLKKSLMQEYFG